MVRNELSLVGRRRTQEAQGYMIHMLAAGIGMIRLMLFPEDAFLSGMQLCDRYKDNITSP
jgi:hypothetical protein